MSWDRKSGKKMLGMIFNIILKKILREKEERVPEEIGSLLPWEDDGGGGRNMVRGLMGFIKFLERWVKSYQICSVLFIEEIDDSKVL